MTPGAGQAPPSPPSPGKGRGIREISLLTNEFAAVRLAVDTWGNGPRLLVEDTGTGARIRLSRLEPASLCLASDDDRAGWPRVGDHRDDRVRRAAPGPAAAGPPEVGEP